jgi:hypothetical protein
MKGKALMTAGLCALTVALAVPAAGVAATPPVTHQQFSYSGTGYPICGLSVDFQVSGAGFDLIRASDGYELGGGSFTSIWTNPASGESIMIHSGGMGTATLGVDNGDGTVSYFPTSQSVYLIKSTNGAPLSLSAGRYVLEVTVDAVTGDIVSVVPIFVSGTSTGPPVDSSCDSIVAALT